MDYGFQHEGHVYTPNKTTVSPDENDTRNATIEHAELEAWKARPGRFVAYYDLKAKTVTTWTGQRLGSITTHRVYRHNFGSRFVLMTVKGDNGATYYGRASYDWGSVIKLKRTRR